MFSGVRRASGVQGLRVIVQSDKPPEYVESRVEAFLFKMGVSLIFNNIAHESILENFVCLLFNGNVI